VKVTQDVCIKNDGGADEYCLLIAREVVALEELLAGLVSFDGDLEDDLRELWDEMAGTAAEESSQYLPSFLDYVNGYCLEFTELGERSGATNEWNVVGARLLRTYGGPHAIIEWNYTNSIVVDVQWGGAHAAKSVFAPNIASALEQLTSQHD
jgi:hypothetical protein